MSILANLITSLDHPEAEEVKRELPKTFSTHRQKERSSETAEAGGDDGLIRRPRSPKLPDYVQRLDWGGPVPAYVEWADEAYEVGGNWHKPVYLLAETRPKPAWLLFPDVRGPGKPDYNAERAGVPNKFPACYWCGRRLYYRTLDGREYCLTCHGLREPQVIRGEFASSEEDLPKSDDRPNIETVQFFLKPGFGPEW